MSNTLKAATWMRERSSCSRQEFWEMLQRLKEKDIAILVSTPYMDEASLCDRVALIQKGRLLSIDQPGKIVSAFDKPLLAIRTNDMYRLIHDLRAFEPGHSAFPFGEYVHLSLRQPIWPERNTPGSRSNPHRRPSKMLLWN